MVIVQHFWSEIDQDVATFMINCVITECFPSGTNDAYITLIPKKINLISTSELQPIVLCNVTYKILSKMLANRMKIIMDGVISTSQSTFVPRRLITDNVVITSEVIHFLNRKREGWEGWCSLKLDMAKAYDKME